MYGKKIPIYEQFADNIEKQIEVGTFRSGDKLPSVRESSIQHKISVSTVLQAYQMLEMKGIIEAKPQSGYYVKYHAAIKCIETNISQVEQDPTEVTIDDISIKLIRDSLNPKLVQFGVALPDPALLPTAKLNRRLVDLARYSKFPQNFS